MKKLLLLLFSVSFFVSCSDDPAEETQDYTSYTITLKAETDGDVFTNVKSAYFNDKRECILLGEHGTLKYGVPTTEFIMPEFHDSIYLFYDYATGMQLKSVFKPKKNAKNDFIISDDATGIFIREKTVYNWPH